MLTTFTELQLLLQNICIQWQSLFKKESILLTQSHLHSSELVGWATQAWEAIPKSWLPLLKPDSDGQDLKHHLTLSFRRMQTARNSPIWIMYCRRQKVQE